MKQLGERDYVSFSRSVGTSTVNSLIHLLRAFQVQTRSADEPMTTFVLCNECGNRWKVSPCLAFASVTHFEFLRVIENKQKCF